MPLEFFHLWPSFDLLDPIGPISWGLGRPINITTYNYVLGFEVSLDNLALDCYLTFGALALGLLAFGAWPTSNKSTAESSES